jgi:hypothetical protein
VRVILSGSDGGASCRGLRVLLMFKLILSPALIGLASWVSRRWGAAAGGWCAALPLTSGPVVLILAMERGPVFAEQASLGALMALVSLAAFALVYSWSASGARWSGTREARGLPWGWSSVAGCVAFLACTVALRTVSLSLPWAFVIACLVLFGALRAMPAHATRGAVAPVRWWDIPLRMALAAILVAALTRAAGAFGARMSGLLTPFPIGGTILAGFTHAFEGAAAASQLLRGLVAGLFSFAVFFLVTGLAITRWDTATTFASATLVTLTFHAAAWRWRAR